MQVAVLGSADSWYFRDLARAAADDHRLVPVSFRALASAVETAHVGAKSGCDDLAACPAVLVRTMPAGSLEQIVFRMDVLGRLAAGGTIVVNPPRAIETAVDKYLATARLAQAGMLVPRTFACQTVDDAVSAFAELGGDVVVKPLFGAEGRGLARITDEGLLLRAAKMLTELGAVIYLQEFIDHPGEDFRLLVVGARVLGMRRRNPLDWRTNVSRGAATSPLDVTAELADLARQASAATATPLAGVDLLPGKDGRLYVVEVNAVPGWRALARTLHVDVARCVLDYVAELCR